MISAVKRGKQRSGCNEYADLANKARKSDSRGREELHYDQISVGLHRLCANRKSVFA